MKKKNILFSLFSLFFFISKSAKKIKLISIKCLQCHFLNTYEGEYDKEDRQICIKMNKSDDEDVRFNVHERNRERVKNYAARAVFIILHAITVLSGWILNTEKEDFLVNWIKSEEEERKFLSWRKFELKWDVLNAKRKYLQKQARRKSITAKKKKESDSIWIDSVYYSGGNYV